MGDTTAAAQAMAARLIAAGFPADDVRVLIHPGNARKGNLVARLRGDGTLKPILLLAHLDVVEARKEDWSPDLDPFRLIERDGYYYGRGTADDKAMASIFVANLIRYRQQGVKFKRDVILALTADEEGGDYNGAGWLVANHRSLVDAEFGLNEGGGGRERNGERLFNGVQASEKIYRDFQLEVTNKGGHSSLPVRDNAIYRLASALDRLAAFDFPVNLNEVTRAFFERTAAIEGGQTAARHEGGRAVERRLRGRRGAALAETAAYNSMLRTTCVATLRAGRPRPQCAAAEGDGERACRILPQESVEDVRRTLARVLADEQIAMTHPSQSTVAAPASPLNPRVMKPIEELTRPACGRAFPTIPVMSTGATDSSHFRANGVPMYGVSGLFGDINDVRAHGRDERVGVKSFYDAQEFLHQLVRRYATAK